jgi:apolipoprotein N-acyltransferase
MSKRQPAPFRRAGAQNAAPTPPLPETFRGRLLLCALTVALLSLAYPPFKQFYLAWFALVPWLVLVAHARTKKALFFWSWITGTLVFAINMWWIGFVTVPGALALMPYLGVWFAVVALVIKGTRLLAPRNDDPAHAQPAWKVTLAPFLVAALWVAQEWIRGNLFTGLPWLYLGHTQTPVLAMCQVADLASAYGVTFWVVLINAWFTLLILHRLSVARLVPAAVAVVAVLLLTLGYGLFRMSQKTTSPGPTVVVVQPNFPQDNTGAKGASLDEIAVFHVRTTRLALEQLRAAGRDYPDLVAWSETMMPEINKAYRDATRGRATRGAKDFGAFLDDIHGAISRLAYDNRVYILAGGVAMLPDRADADGKIHWTRRNSAYYFDRFGIESTLRYDKIHLVPFGEYMPFKKSFPLLYKFFNLFNPYGSADYTVVAGEELTVYPLFPAFTLPSATAPSSGPSVKPREWRFVSPICFEDVDSALCAQMFRPEKAGGATGAKRADFMVNLTNDGWFAFNQMPQHLQISIFRSIENRAPLARSVNTGISGFIDSVGRTYDLIPVGQAAAHTARLDLDSRLTFYTRFGDLFAGACVLTSALLVARGAWNGFKNRSRNAR